MSINKWNKSYKENYEFYQNKLNYLMYNFQRSLSVCNNLGGFIYPYFYQKKYLNYELYQKKQNLGEIYNEEVNEYEKYNSNIKSDLNLIFNNNYFIPKYGLGFGLFLTGFLTYFKAGIKFRIGSIIFPCFLELLYSNSGTIQFKNTVEFLDYTLAKRISNERLNINKKYFDSEKIKFIQSQTNKSLDELNLELCNL